MKYVAFLDILGFKDKLSSLNQSEAKKYISNFSSTIYSVWEKMEKTKIEGYIVSDSIILNTVDVSLEALYQLIDIVDRICKKEFSSHSILVRGAIAKGEFDKLEAKEISSLNKGLIVGQAYVDAYLLEGTVKMTGIVLSKAVHEDLQQSKVDNYNLIEENDTYILRYLDIDFLLSNGNLDKFIELAQNAQWLPHYYNTLYFSLKNNRNESKVDKFFNDVLTIVSQGNVTENWRDTDIYIQNAFDKNVIHYFQVRFLKYIRSHLKGSEVNSNIVR